MSSNSGLIRVRGLKKHFPITHGLLRRQVGTVRAVDGIDFESIGTIGPGTPLTIREETFDFAGLFADPVRFVRVERTANGRQTGMFFDAFGGTAASVPEPQTLLMILPVAVAFAMWRTRAQHRQRA